MIYNILKSLVFFAVIIGLGSCKKDSEEFIPNESDTFTSNITGHVFDDNFDPVIDATVVFDGNTTTTNKYGIYQFKNISLDSRHNNLSITKENYFTNTRTFRSNSSKHINLRSQMISKAYDRSFESSSGGIVSKGQSSVSFEPNSIVFDGTENEYTGEVQVAMEYISPVELNMYFRMPGDLTAVNNENDIQALNSFGMLAVELRTPSGQALQIMNGKKAEISSKVESSILAQAPESIPLRYFDHDLGLWKEEGSAILEGDTYVGEVSHFTYWNYDDDGPSIILSGRVVDGEGRPISGVHIWVAASDSWGGGHGDAAADGTFSGAVRANEILNFKILDYNGQWPCSFNDPLLEIEIGPFASDTDIGDIVLDFEDGASLKITAGFLSCDGNPITNGAVLVNGKYYNMENSAIDLQIPICNSASDYSLEAFDLDALKQTDPIDLDANIVNSLGEVIVCDQIADHLIIKNDDYGIDKIFKLELDIYRDTTTTEKSLSAFDFDSNTKNYVSITYNDNSQNSYDIGLFASTNANIYLGNDNFSHISGEVDVDSYDAVNDKISGTFTIKALSGSDNSETEFTGSFKLPAR